MSMSLSSLTVSPLCALLRASVSVAYFVPPISASLPSAAAPTVISVAAMKTANSRASTVLFMFFLLSFYNVSLCLMPLC